MIDKVSDNPSATRMGRLVHRLLCCDYQGNKVAIVSGREISNGNLLRKILRTAGILQTEMFFFAIRMAPRKCPPQEK